MRIVFLCVANSARRCFSDPSLSSDEAAARSIRRVREAAATGQKRSAGEWHTLIREFAMMFKRRFPMA